MRATIIMAVCVLLFTGCTKEIDLDLKDEAPRIVIEANVQNGEGVQSVRITRSMAFDAVGAYPTVNGAEVSVSDGNGQVFPFQEVSAGEYQSTAFVGVPGTTYTLNIVIDGERYTATSQMPEVVTFEQLLFNEFEFPGDTAMQYAALPIYTDPIRSGNCYRFLIWVNGELDNSIYISNDNVGNGQQNVFPLLSAELDMYSGDTVRVEMRGIDKRVYDFYYQWNLLSGSGTDGVAPANPPSNIQGKNVLGYFSAHTVQSIEAIIP